MTNYEQQFLERYNKLNDRQKQAVDQVFGPVMVIAGPGTGKTEVLAMRIASLLRSESQVQPWEILCLTYTEEATASMRRRLVQIIGPAAHKVNIHTFHAFCNNIIQQNAHFFSLRALQPVSDLERTDFLYKLLDGLPAGHPLRKLSGKVYFDASRISRLFDLMKREYLEPATIAGEIDRYIQSLPQREEYIYKRNGKGYKLGDLKQNLIDEETRKMETTKAAALLFDEYEQMMKDAGRYDFNDMILWVLQAFRKNAALLQSYQERYQFILVDEFQDTNGSQNELLTMLASYWEDPNIFVVGDDDQGVYEFQGARIRNITDFYHRYKESISIVVLPQNYRSSQQILDRAMAAISNNNQRLISQLRHLQLSKNLVASSDRFLNTETAVEPAVCAYNNIIQEECSTVLQIEKLRNEGVALNNIAIIYARHSQVDNIVSVMERRGIPYNTRKAVNVLDENLVQQVLMMLRYLADEKKKTFSGEDALFELMHAPCFGILPVEIARLALYLQHSRKEKGPIRWRLLLSDPLLLESLELRSAKAMTRLGFCLDNWEQQQTLLPLPLLVEKILHEGGIIAWLLQTAEHVWNLQVLYTFFQFVKDTWARIPSTDSSRLLDIVGRMHDEGISLPLQKVVQRPDGVHCYTAHSAKGNEFEYVFLIGCNKNFWEDKKGSNQDFRLPDTITATADDAQKSSQVEVARRLFYVALTRAKKFLNVSYATADNNGKPLEPSVFVDEISTQSERSVVNIPTPELARFMAENLAPVPEVRIQVGNADWVERELQQFILSATSLSKYLHCPLAFYYENILKVPFQKNDALAFGSAVHHALEQLFVDMKSRRGDFAPVSVLLSWFRSALFAESAALTPPQYNRRLEQGETLLTEYYNHFITTFHKEVEIEYKVPRYLFEGIPVTGKIDKLEIDGPTCRVIDYKTGDPDKSAHAMTSPPNDKDLLGGDYWRQMVFYKLILEHYEEHPRKVALGRFDYIQKSKTGEYKQIVVPVFGEDEEKVKKQMKDVYFSIMNHEFDKGCGDENCHWCNFARRYQLIRPAGNEEWEMYDV